MRSSTWYGGADMRLSMWTTINWGVAGLMLLAFGLTFSSRQPVGVSMARAQLPQAVESAPPGTPSRPTSTSEAPPAPPTAVVLRLSQAVQQLDADVLALREAVVRLPPRGR